MVPSAASGRPSRLARIAEWWRVLRERRAGLDELEKCGPEIGRIAQDVGLPVSDLYALARKGRGAADLLTRRLGMTGLDPAALSRTAPRMLQDLQRVCTLCESRRRCRSDLSRRSPGPGWLAYCPNAPTLEALTQEAGKPAAAQAH